ncbi:MAG: hypothetical protein ACP5R4_08330 [Armatimonadota bacterium]
MTIEELRKAHEAKRGAIRARLAEFEETYRRGDRAIFEELVFCIFTAGASARMGLRCVEAVRPILLTGNETQLLNAINGLHLYPAARAAYIVHTRDYLQRKYDLRMQSLLESLTDHYERRRFFAENPNIKGIGYKEASHFLRNIGFRGYAILDKHVLRSLHEFGVIPSPNPPKNARQYLEIEGKMKEWADSIQIDFDELDLLLWSNKTGEILK